MFIACDDEVKDHVIARSNLSSAVFGGEGLFNTTVTGPGKIYIQSMPIEKVATRIYYSMPNSITHHTETTTTNSSSSSDS